jgi:PKD repeat protein
MKGYPRGDVRLLVVLLGVAVWIGGCQKKENELPTAAFSMNCSALACTFTDKSSDPDGSIESRHWTFGDGATSSAASPSHDYTANATSEFSVELTVTDDEGGQSVASKTFNVSPPIPLQCQNAQDPSQVDDCTLSLNQAARIEIELTSRDCAVTGNTLVVLQPVQMTLFTDGCYAPDLGTVFTISDNGNPFAAGTPIGLQVLSGAGTQIIPPSLVVLGSAGPPWVLRFDDGANDPPDEDITLTIRTMP